MFEDGAEEGDVNAHLAGHQVPSYYRILASSIIYYKRGGFRVAAIAVSSRYKSLVTEWLVYTESITNPPFSTSTRNPGTSLSGRG